MLCDIAMTAAAAVTLAFAPSAAAAQASAVAAQPSAAFATSTANPLAREPLYADIVQRAASLKAEVGAYRASPPPAATPLPDQTRLETEIGALSALDMQGHVDLAKRGTDGDLKCILKGISQDLLRKLTEIEKASTPEARKTALQDLFYLLRDNVEVITTKPTTMS